MTDRSLKIHSESNICSICNKPFKWTKRYWIRDHVLPELELITAHACCRHKLRKLTEKKEQLKNDILDVEWEIFCLFYKDEPVSSKITVKNGEILCNGIFNIKN